VLAVVDGRDAALVVARVDEADQRARTEQEGQLALGAPRARDGVLADRELHALPEAQALAGRERLERGQLARCRRPKQDRPAPFGMAEPAPTPIAELDEPFLPAAAGGVRVFRAPGEHERLPLVATGGAELEPRPRRGQVGELPERVDAAIGARDRRMARRTDAHEAVVVAELERRATARAFHVAPPLTVSIRAPVRENGRGSKQ